MDLAKMGQSIFIILLLTTNLAATLVGNPAQPAIQNSGLICSRPSEWSFRLSYFGDYVYKQRFNDEFTIGDCVETPTNIQFWTQAGMLTFNIRERIDLYAILGGSRIQINDEVKTTQQLSWGIGGKLIIVQEGRFRVGLDIKYFRAELTPAFLQCDHLAYNVVSQFQFNYQEIQAAMGIAYTTKYLSPYATATYLIAKIEPVPLITLVRLPQFDFNVEAASKSVIGSRRWGMALGTTIIDNRKASLALEWRVFNQNSVDVIGEIRF